MRKLILILFSSLPYFIFSQSTPDTIFQYFHKADRKAPTEALVLLKVEVFDYHRKRIPELPVSVVGVQSKQVWHGKTGTWGEVFFLVPKGKQYRIDGGGQEGLKMIRLPNAGNLRSSFGVTYVADMFSEKTVGDTVFQTIEPKQPPTRNRTLTKIEVFNFSEKPLVRERLFFTAKKSKKIYTASADEKGRATLMLPKGDTFCLSTTYVTDVDCFYLKKDEFAQTMRLTYHTIGTEEFMRREKERARQAAIRDSIYKEKLKMDSIRFFTGFFTRYVCRR